MPSLECYARLVLRPRLQATDLAPPLTARGLRQRLGLLIGVWESDRLFLRRQQLLHAACLLVHGAFVLALGPSLGLWRGGAAQAVLLLGVLGVVLLTTRQLEPRLHLLLLVATRVYCGPLTAFPAFARLCQLSRASELSVWRQVRGHRPWRALDLDARSTAVFRGGGGEPPTRRDNPLPCLQSLGQALGLVLFSTCFRLPRRANAVAHIVEAAVLYHLGAGSACHPQLLPLGGAPLHLTSLAVFLAAGDGVLVDGEPGPLRRLLGSALERGPHPAPPLQPVTGQSPSADQGRKDR